MTTSPERYIGLRSACVNYITHLGKTISFNHPCVYRIELSNPSCLTVVCKRGSVEFTDTVMQRGLEVRYGIHMVLETFSYTFVSFNVL